ncbi:sugar transporter [Rubellimicrobium roseum]|uniref:Sugar transporter n=2 Tax=Rubellimicrobium roseum TaxID=687525 RepID=A0A5C4NBX8_9RHOB|nr:sugar transporter [Rubellimicrobium roseum]
MSLGGCGVSYVSPLVREDPNDGVQVVEITRDTLSVANAATYVPRALPPAFTQAAGGGSLRGAGALPAPPEVPEFAPVALDLRPPPPATPEPYRIGVSDVVQLATRSAATAPDATVTGTVSGSEVRQTYTVRDDGTIAVPEVGTVQVGGLTIEEAEQRVFERFLDSGIDPDFSLEIAGFNARSISVGGEVGQPGNLPVGLRVPRLDEVLAEAGGLAVDTPEFASIRIYRDGTLYQIPLDDYTERAELRDVQLLPGDSVFVDTSYDLDRALGYYSQQLNAANLRRAERTAALEELRAEIAIRRDALADERALFAARAELGAEPRDYVYLTGEVARQRRFALPYGQPASLADALFEDGGFETETGNPSQIYVLRANDGSTGEPVTAWHLDVRNAANLTLATRFEMRPDDIVFIEEQPITRWNRAFQQFFPTVINTASSAVD